jgi:hypothetical protein
MTLDRRVRSLARRPLRTTRRGDAATTTAAATTTTTSTTCRGNLYKIHFTHFCSVRLILASLSKTTNSFKKFPAMGLYHPLDGVTNPKYKLLHLLTTKIFLQREGTSF